MSTSVFSATTTESSNSTGPNLIFIDHTSKDAGPHSNGKRSAQQKSIRAHVARVSSSTRCETIRKRAEGRTRKPGEAVFSIQVPKKKAQKLQEPLPRVAVEQHQKTLLQYQNREESVALHSDAILGGPIPAAQANIAILSQFLHRFRIGNNQSERPWIELVLERATSTTTPSLVTMALQANASAICANDLQRPEVSRYATQLYLSTITSLQSSLKGPNWRDSVVMYTCMILTLYECIQSQDPTASYAHVRGVAHLIEQKGPESFIGGLEHRTFRYYRINLFMMCLIDCQPCFLAEPAWKTVPFSGDCPPKTMLDKLVDILAELPGVLATIKVLKEGGLSTYALVQKAFELAYWVRCLTHDLEKWKEDNIWTHPAIYTTPNLRNLNILALCELATGQIPYNARLGEALNCFLAAHLILARITHQLGEKSFLVRTALSSPYSLQHLVAGIALISENHISHNATDMVSMMVTAFPLRVAQSTAKLEDSAIARTVEGLIGQIDHEFARRYNMNYSASSEKRAYQV